MEVTVKINSDSPTGHRLLRDLEKHKKVVKIENPLPDGVRNGDFYELDDVIARGDECLITHYGEEMKILLEGCQ